MRKGWKNRFNERRYFEQKKQEREERAVLMELMRIKFIQEMQVELNKKEMEMH